MSDIHNYGRRDELTNSTKLIATNEILWKRLISFA